jgi:taurine dioxygenase
LLEYKTMPPESTHPRRTYPLAHRHPKTGMPLLFFSEMPTSHIDADGYDTARSEALVQKLFRSPYDSSNVYIHRWSPGGLVIWDNMATQHGRRSIGDATNVARGTLRRAVVCEKRTKEIFGKIGYNNSKGFKARG